jgi:ssDNA thymidine ADP-ribosyltransferase DarT-like protein
VNVADLTELHYITPIANVPSILKFGILSNREIKRRRVKAVSVALSGVQERRESKVVPGAKPLHEYVNLYICARNPMMYLRRAQHEALCVLQISPAVLTLPGVVIADGNAASGPTAFWQSPSGLSKVDKDIVFAEWWTDPDPFVLWENRRVKCAEVLVPDKLDAKLIAGAYVSCEAAEDELKALAPRLKINVDPHMFFRA